MYPVSIGMEVISDYLVICVEGNGKENFSWVY